MHQQTLVALYHPSRIHGICSDQGRQVAQADTGPGWRGPTRSRHRKCLVAKFLRRKGVEESFIDYILRRYLAYLVVLSVFVYIVAEPCIDNFIIVVFCSNLPAPDAGDNDVKSFLRLATLLGVGANAVAADFLASLDLRRVSVLHVYSQRFR